MCVFVFNSGGQLRGVVGKIQELEEGLREGQLAWTVANAMSCIGAVEQMDAEMFCVHELRTTVMRILDDTVAATDDTLQVLGSHQHNTPFPTHHNHHTHARTFGQRRARPERWQ